MQLWVHVSHARQPQHGHDAHPYVINEHYGIVFACCVVQQKALQECVRLRGFGHLAQCA